MRRTLIIVASAIVLIGIIAGTYFVFFSNKSPQLTADNNPFANTNAGNSGGGAPAGTDTGVPSEGAGNQIAPSFIQITSQPVALGFSALYIPPQKISTPSTTATTTDITESPSEVDIRYIDRASGNVYSYRFHQRSLTRLSNKTLPGVQKASWLSNGTLAFAQYLSQDAAGAEHIETYALPSGGEGGYFLERDLDQVLVSSSTALFSLLSNGNGSVGTLAKPDGSGARTVFSSPLSSLSAGFAGKNFIAYTKPSATVPGYGFSVDAATGAFTRILGPLTGLSLLASPSGTSILYSYIDQGTLRLAVLDIATQTTTMLPLETLAEKCAWASDGRSVYCAVPTTLSGTLPDDWYQGAASLSDRIWKIDLSSRIATLVVDPNIVASKQIDAADLTLDAQSDVLVFMDRKTGVFYAYDL